LTADEGRTSPEPPLRRSGRPSEMSPGDDRCPELPSAYRRIRRSRARGPSDSSTNRGIVEPEVDTLQPAPLGGVSVSGEAPAQPGGVAHQLWQEPRARRA